MINKWIKKQKPIKWYKRSHLREEPKLRQKEKEKEAYPCREAFGQPLFSCVCDLFEVLGCLGPLEAAQTCEDNRRSEGNKLPH